MRGNDRIRRILFTCTLVAAVLLPAPGAAWEVKVEDVGRRIQEVQGRWKDAKGEPVLKSILGRGKRGKKPGWAKKVRAASDQVCWSESYGGKTYYFGVGLAEKIRDPFLRMTAAQDRARASLVELLGAVKTAAGVEGSVAGAIPIDWYPAKGNSLYALLVVVR
jgi:hypothetical protein